MPPRRRAGRRARGRRGHARRRRGGRRTRADPLAGEHRDVDPDPAGAGPLERRDRHHCGGGRSAPVGSCRRRGWSSPTSTPRCHPSPAATVCSRRLLLRADYLLAADERHRDLWLGRLAAITSTGRRDALAGRGGRHRPVGRPRRGPSRTAPVVLAHDRVGCRPPRRARSRLAVRAVHELRRRHADVTLVFTSPRPDVERIAGELAIAGSHVVTTGWLTDAERRQLLVDADIALLTHSRRARSLPRLRTGAP